MKFLALYMAPTGVFEQMMADSTPEQQKAGMDAWTDWMKAHQESIADMGAPVGATKRVTAGGVADVRNEVGGYSIIEADSHDAAAALFADSPHLHMMPEAFVDVSALLAMPT